MRNLKLTILWIIMFVWVVLYPTYLAETVPGIHYD